MKTNQIMIRENVAQRTCDSYFNATLTCENWNARSGERKKVSEYLRIKGTKELIDYLMISESIEKPFTSSNKGTWMHPLLYVDFCMWISVEFKAQALKYVLDGLIKTRHLAGDYYNEMTAAIMTRYYDLYGCKPAPMVYINEAKTINAIAGVLGKERNEMTEDELNKVTILQKVNTTLIKDGVGKEARKKQLNIIARSL